MENSKPQCGSNQGGPKAEYDLPLHVVGLCKLNPKVAIQVAKG